MTSKPCVHCGREESSIIHDNVENESGVVGVHPYVEAILPWLVPESKTREPLKARIEWNREGRMRILLFDELSELLAMSDWAKEGYSPELLYEGKQYRVARNKERGQYCVCEVREPAKKHSSRSNLRVLEQA